MLKKLQFLLNIPQQSTKKVYVTLLFLLFFVASFHESYSQVYTVGISEINSTGFVEDIPGNYNSLGTKLHAVLWAGNAIDINTLKNG
jgi:hypothetical protein